MPNITAICAFAAWVSHELLAFFYDCFLLPLSSGLCGDPVNSLQNSSAWDHMPLTKTPSRIIFLGKQ